MTMTLGTLIEVVENIWQNGDDSMSVHYLKDNVDKYEENEHLVGIGDLYSWRGCYTHLCLETKMTNDWVGIEQFLCRIRGALGMTFTGYKGGSYKMDEDTPVWRGFHTQSNRHTLGITHLITDDNLVLIKTKLIDTYTI